MHPLPPAQIGAGAHFVEMGKQGIVASPKSLRPALVGPKIWRLRDYGVEQIGIEKSFSDLSETRISDKLGQFLNLPDYVPQILHAFWTWSNC